MTHDDVRPEHDGEIRLDWLVLRMDRIALMLEGDAARRVSDETLAKVGEAGRRLEEKIVAEQTRRLGQEREGRWNASDAVMRDKIEGRG